MWTRGKGVQNPEKIADVICTWPLRIATVPLPPSIGGVPFSLLFESGPFCYAMEAVAVFGFCHRAFGGTVIAAVRRVALNA